MKMVQSFPKGLKTLWKQGKLLVTSNFSFSSRVFKRIVLQTCKNKSLLGKGVNATQSSFEIIQFWRMLVSVIQSRCNKFGLIKNKKNKVTLQPGCDGRHSFIHHRDELLSFHFSWLCAWIHFLLFLRKVLHIT